MQQGMSAQPWTWHLALGGSLRAKIPYNPGKGWWMSVIFTRSWLVFGVVALVGSIAVGGQQPAVLSVVVAEKNGVRVDSYGHDRCRVSARYDSLLAKVIVHQPTREEAISCMQRCLREFTVEPIHTTLPFLRKVLAHPHFVAGTIDTGFVERNGLPEATT